MLEINTNIAYIHELTLAMTATKESDAQQNYNCEPVPAIGVLSALGTRRTIKKIGNNSCLTNKSTYLIKNILGNLIHIK